MNNLESQMPLSSQEVSFLEEKKSSLQSYLILCAVGLVFNAVICFAGIEDLPAKYFLIFAASVIFLIPIVRYWGKVSDINKDLSGGVKKVLDTQIDSYEEAVSRNEQGRRTMSTYYLSLGGEKYEVKEEHYYPLNEGDFVNAYVAPHSKYAFYIEKTAQKH